MKREDFFFHLPKDLIARFPETRRDGSRLMVINRGTGEIHHHRFSDIVDLIEPGDFMVVNHSRVIPARLLGRIDRAEVEALVVKTLDQCRAEVLALPARKFRDGVRIRFDDHLEALVVGQESRGRRLLEFNREIGSVMKKGYAPLPPYIKRKPGEARKYREYDLQRYQTVYSSRPGSIAAPTAGLHFTSQLLDRIRQRNPILEIELKVGEATFQKIETVDIQDHRMGRETIAIPRSVRSAIDSLKKKKELVAVGTTTVRALETLALEQPESDTFESELFIYPGFEFRMIDKLITNFHLPESSLFILVSAFAGLELMKEAYRIAVEQEYRFFSYGDAMFIL